MCHVYVRADNLAGVLISDDEYPHRVAHTLLTKVNEIYFHVKLKYNFILLLFIYLNHELRNKQPQFTRDPPYNFLLKSSNWLINQYILLTTHYFKIYLF